MMPPCETFDYVATAPENPADPSAPWTVRLRQLATPTGDKVLDDRLVGYTPALRITDAGLAPDSLRCESRVLRSRVTLTASSRKDAAASSISFYVDRGLIAQIQPGDDLHMGRTGCGGQGLSLIRRGELVLAAGAVTAVELGKDFTARHPDQLTLEAARIFQARDPAFTFPEHPIEFVHKKQRRILFRGTCRLDPYEILLRHGFLRGIPGMDESAAICKAQDGVPAFASASAQLLENDSIEIVPWPGD